MDKSRETSDGMPEPAVAEAWQQVGASFERFCLTAGVSALRRMMEQDAVELCGPRYGHKDGKAAHRWGKTEGKIGFHGGKVSLTRPRVRARDGQEMVLPSWEAAQSEDLLGRWAMNLMLINVSTRRFGRAVRLPEGDIPAPAGAGVSKSAVSRRFVALSATQMEQWMATDLSKLDLLVIQRRRWREAPHWCAGRRNGERCGGAGAAGQPGRARSRPEDLPSVHHRRIEGAAEGDPTDVWQAHADPALSGAQGAQHPGAPAEAPACVGAADAASGVGTG